ncbi:MAG: RNA polymerase sigma factor [Alphaproteobacteria bacterium]|nr:RNA polymerase sigma factor [Alphaproteobacteria bacterium]
MVAIDWKIEVKAAQAGDRTALENILSHLQDRVHPLSMRMLVNPADAQEATQEILILVITKLSTFRGDSAFTTWAYRVAANYLLTARKIADRDPGLTFNAFAADLEHGLVADPPRSADDTVMLNELRISCTMAMLLCLDLKHRMAYVLGDILEFDHGEAAEIIGISSGNFRKRLSRARAQVVAFTTNHCGLANEHAACSCPRRLPAAIAQGRITPGRRVDASQNAPPYEQVLARVRGVEGQLKVLKLQTAMPRFPPPSDLGARLIKILQDGP